MTRITGRRWVRAIAAAAAMLVVAWVLVQLPWTTRRLGSLVLGAIEARVPGTLETETFDVGIIPLGLRATGVKWRSPDASVAADVAEVAAQVSLGSLLTLDLVEPRIRVTNIGGVEGAEAEIPAWLLGATIQVSDGALTIDDDSTALELGPIAARVDFRPSGIEILDARIQKNGSSVAGAARLASLAPLAVDASLTASIELADFRELGVPAELSGLLVGESELRHEDGVWLARGSVNSSALEVSGAGSFEMSSSFQLDADGVRLEDARLSGLDGFDGVATLGARWDFSPDRQTLDVTVTEARMASGPDARIDADGSFTMSGWDLTTVSGSAQMKLRGRPQGDVRATLADGRVALATTGVTIDGYTFDGSGEMSGSWENPRASAELSLRDGKLGDVPVDVSGRLSWSGDAIAIEALHLRQGPNGTLTLSGTFDPASGIASLRGDGGGFTLDEPSLETSATISAVHVALDGPAAALAGETTLDLSEVRVKGVPLPDTTLTFVTDGSTARISGRAPGAPDLLSLHADLSAPYAVEGTARLDALPVQELVRTVPGLSDVTLDLDATLDISGALADLEATLFRITAERFVGVVHGITLGASAPFIVAGDRDRITVSGLTVIGDDTAIDIEGTIPLSLDGRLDLSVTGSSRLELLDAFYPDAAVAGHVDAAVTITGTRAAPTLSGSLDVSEAAALLGDIPIEDVRAALSFEEARIVVDTVSGGVGGGRFIVDGMVPLASDGPRSGRLRFRLDALDPATLTDSDLSWIEELTVSVAGELAGAGLDPSAWRGSGVVADAHGRAGTTTLDQRSTARWTLDGGLFELSELRLTGSASDLAIDVTARPWQTPLDWSADVTGTLNPNILAPVLAGSGASVTGTTDLAIHARMAQGGFSLAGAASLRDGRMTIREPALSLTNLSADLELTDNAIRLTGLTARAGGGTIEAHGVVVVSGATTTSIDLEAAASSVRMSYPEGLRSELGAELRLHGTPSALTLSGDVLLARAIFSRDISVESELLQSLASVPSRTASAGIAQTTRLDVRLRTRDGLRVDNNLARMEASASLQLVGTVAAPEVVGTITARDGGEFRLGRNRYRIESGRITLDGYPSAPPQIEVSARTSVADYDIRMRVNGSTDDLTTELSGTSQRDQSSISATDAASLLVTGRTMERVSSQGRADLGEQMVSFVGGSLADLAQLGLGDALPFRLITVAPELVTAEADPRARFTLGAELTEALSVIYSVGLEDAEKQIWIVDYQLPHRTQTQMIRQEDNEFTFALAQQLRIAGPGDAHAAAPRSQLSRVGFHFITGEPDSFRDAAQEKLGLTSGASYEYWDAWHRAEQLREWLRGDGFLDTTVDLDASPCGPGCMELDAFVATGKRVRFEWIGDDARPLLERALSDAWDGYLTPEFLTAELTAVAERELFGRGHYRARVDVRIADRAQETTVRIETRLGAPGRGVELRFTGNHSLDAVTLAESLPSPTSPELHDLLTTKTPRLRQLLEVRFASSGFLAATVGTVTSRFDAERQVLVVTIPVDEGVQSMVSGIDLDGVERVDPALVRQGLALTVGQPFRLDDFVADRAAIAAMYRRRGFRTVEVDAAAIEDGGASSLTARYLVREGPPVVAGDISITGNARTRERIVRRELRIEPGEPLTTDSVNETKRRLYELGIFRSADVVVSGPDPDDAAARDVEIHVAETPVATLDYGLRYTTDGHAEVLADVKTPNLFGSAQRTGFRTLIGTERKIFRFTYQTPYVLPLKLDTNFFVERVIDNVTPDADEDFFPFTDRIWSFTAQQSRPFRDRLDLQWSYSFRRTETEIEIPGEDALPSISLDRGILSASLIGDFRDNVVRPSLGSFWSVSVSGAPEALGAELTFLKVFGQLYTFVPLGNGVTWAGGYRLGAANSFGGPMVQDDRFQAGGPNSVRGFAYESLGPVDPVLERTRGGKAVLIVNQEIRFPIAWHFGGVAFYDAGNAFESPTELSLSDLRQSAGAGIRVELPFGVIRFDWAKVVARREGEDPWRWIFSLGHAF